MKLPKIDADLFDSIVMVAFPLLIIAIALACCSMMEALR